MVAAPTFVRRQAAVGNYGYGRAYARDLRFTCHHVVGSAESAALTFATPGRQASATFTVTNIPGIIFQHINISDTPYSDGNADSNTKTISAEHHGDWRYGYRDETVIANAAWLVAWLRQEGYITHYYRHWQVSQLGTACSCDLPMEEIWTRATALLGGNAVTPGAPTAVKVNWHAYDKPRMMVTNKEPTTLWRFDKADWGAFGSGSKTFPKGTPMEIWGEGYNTVLDATYFLTKFSLESKAPNGFNLNDLDDHKPVAKINWTDLPTKPYVVLKDTDLWDFGGSSWGEIKSLGKFKKGDRVDISARAVNTMLGAAYLVTEYSHGLKRTSGWNEKDLAPYVAPKPAPTPAPAPAKPEWIRNLKNYDAPVKLIVTAKQTPVVELVVNQTLKQLGQGTVVDVAAETTVGGKVYVISSWSAKQNAAQGMLKSDFGVPVAEVDKPKWLQGWEDIADVDMYVRADTVLWNLVDSTPVKTLNRGEKVRVASTSSVFGQKYALTEYSTSKLEGRGIRLDDLDLKPVTDTPPVTTPVDAVPKPPTVEERLTWLEKFAQSLGFKK